MKAFWTVLAILFAALAVGTIASLNERAGSGTSLGIGDIAITAVLATLAWASWKSARR
ncbi:hypothetical protein [Streptomyces scopuliridis]|uniref:Uncharacterized protein n=1 Tax=Streptomyces scopuliridis RB72 TaxID=1440053 RepID=A0A2T7T0B1_9ACTN|nr:hypothetical protein [Streptomyces scopuliridis]PVE08564.1 hypothetical protein Y717_16655 [Streptomyces scopuliridis RB72]